MSGQERQDQNTMDKMEEGNTEEERYVSYNIEGTMVGDSIEKLAQEGEIKRVHPLDNIASQIRVYKSGHFNLAVYDNTFIEFSKLKLDSSKSLSEKISEIEQKINYKFK